MANYGTGPVSTGPVSSLVRSRAPEHPFVADPAGDAVGVEAFE
jgi:hypothetical protein